MEFILKRNLKNFFSVLSVDLFMFWKGKLQGLDHRNQVTLEFPGAEMNVLREPSQATEEGGNEQGGVTRRTLMSPHILESWQCHLLQPPSQ